MQGFELAKLRVEQECRAKFYQDFYGRQWVKIDGGWKIWRSCKIVLENDEVVALKTLLGRRRRLRAGKSDTPESDVA